MIEFLGHSNHFHIAYQLAFFIRSANFRRWFLQIEYEYDLYNIMPTYDRVFGSFWPLSYFQLADVFG